MLRKTLRIIFLAVLLTGVGWGGYQIALITYKKYELQKEILALQSQEEALKTKHRDLVAFLDSFSNQAMLEQELKRRLNVKKKDEEVVILVPDGETAAGQSPTAPTDELLANIANVALGNNDDSPNWLKWWRYFFAP